MARQRRSFSAQFKAQLVLEILTGVRSQAEICRQHQLKPQLLAHWKATVLEGLPSLFGDEQQHDHEQTRIAELEQLLGRQAYELEILKKASRLLPGRSSRNGRSS